MGASIGHRNGASSIKQEIHPVSFRRMKTFWTRVARFLRVTHLGEGSCLLGEFVLDWLIGLVGVGLKG